MGFHIHLGNHIRMQRLDRETGSESRGVGADDEDEKKAKIKKLKNGKVQKVDGMEMDLDSIFSRIQPIGFEQFNVQGVDRSVMDIYVDRDYISERYGGNAMAVFPSIKADRIAEHGIRSFAFMNCLYQPYAPQVVGCPGLYFCCDPESAVPDCRTYKSYTFVRIGPRKWQYLGLYEFKKSVRFDLTTEEWKRRQPGQGHWQKVWSTQIVSQDWGKDVRVRMLGRQVHGRNPTNEEAKVLAKDTRVERFTPDDVDAAFKAGQEALHVWTAKCVGYDAQFATALARDFPTWVPKEQAPRKQPMKKKRRQTKVKRER